VAKPIVDGLEQGLSGKASVIRLDALSAIGQQAAAHFDVRGMPTLIVVDGQGEVVLTQMGIIRPSPVRDQVERLVN